MFLRDKHKETLELQQIKVAIQIFNTTVSGKTMLTVFLTPGEEFCFRPAKQSNVLDHVHRVFHCRLSVPKSSRSYKVEIRENTTQITCFSWNESAGMYAHATLNVGELLLKGSLKRIVSSRKSQGRTDIHVLCRTWLEQTPLWMTKCKADAQLILSRNWVSLCSNHYEMLGTWEISGNEQVPYKACLRTTLSEMITTVLQATPLRGTEMQCSLKSFNLSGSFEKVFLS